MSRLQRFLVASIFMGWDYTLNNVYCQIVITYRNVLYVE